MPGARPRKLGCGAVAATLPSGEVLIAGGSWGTASQKSAELFNPVTDRFSKLTLAGGSPDAREEAVAATLPSGQVLIAGGRGFFEIDKSAQLFDPGTGTSSPLSGSPVERRRGAIAAILPNGQVLIAGGFDGQYLSSAELFNPATDTFTEAHGSPPVDGRSTGGRGGDDNPLGTSV